MGDLEKIGGTGVLATFDGQRGLPRRYLEATFAEAEGR